MFTPNDARVRIIKAKTESLIYPDSYSEKYLLELKKGLCEWLEIVEDRIIRLRHDLEIHHP